MKKKNEEFLKICKAKLKYLNYADRTSDIYLSYIEKFLLHADKYPAHLNSSDFQDYLDQFVFTSVSQQNQVINAIRFLYINVLQKKYKKVSFQRPRKERKLPQVIDQQHILSSLAKIENIKHRAILTLCYSVGLRVSELVNMKIADVDSKRMIINVRQAKGNKDRIVPLSPHVLKLLRDYFIKYRPVNYLFNGQNSEQYSITSCQKLFKKYIDNNSSIHKLRHSCFTHLMESGTDLRIIQNIAGHNSSRTTEIYTHVSTQHLNQVRTPI